MKNIKFSLLLYPVLLIMLCFQSFVNAVDVTLNWNDQRQVIDGFGGCSGRPHSPTSLAPLIQLSSAEQQAILDFQYLQDDGCLGISHVRQPIPDWLMPSQGVWDWSALDDQAWYNQEVLKRNPNVKFWAVPWSPPGWMKVSGVADGTGDNARDVLRTDMYQELADYFSTYIREYKNRWGIDISALSLQNEPDLPVTYEVCLWGPNEMIPFIRDYLKPTFERDNVTTLYVLGDQCSWYEGPIPYVMNDPVCRDFIDIGAAHQYWKIDSYPFAVLKDNNKKQWQTETSQIGSSGDELKDSILMARYIHENMAYAESNAWDYYTLWDPRDGRWALFNTTSNFPKRAYALGHFSRFIRPGYYRVAMSGPGTTVGTDPSGVYTSAYKDTITGKFVIVAINDTTSAQNLNITFNGLDAVSLTPYTTTRTQNMEHLSDISVSNNVATLTLPPESMVTYTGQTITFGTPTKVLITADPVLVEANGTATSEITARICDANNITVANSNATVNFSLSGSAGGSLSAVSVQAVDGVAVITYTAGTAEGTVTITGTSNGLTQGTANVTLRMNNPPSAPSNLLCNGQSNPASVDDFTPDLSWDFSDPDNGDTQGAYRIIVADNQNDINNNIGNIWDTGKIISNSNTVTYTGTSILQSLTQYWWKVKVWDNLDAEGTYSQTATFTMADIDPRVYPSGSAPKAVPGKIEAEDYDIGGEGITYHETTYNNEGDTYRTGTGEGVDIEACSDTGGGYDVGWTAATEWIEYTVDVQQTAAYTIEAKVASSGQGNDFHIEFAGTDRTGTMTIPDTGGWQNWTTVSKTGVSLTAGKQIMRIVIDGGGVGGNFNFINIVHEGSIQPQITVTSPDGGETWTEGEQQTVTWTSQGTVGNINIDLSTDNGTNWTRLISDTANNGTQVITLPNSPGTNCRIKVEDISGTPSDTSNSNFTILALPQPQITVTVPNGGETWQANSQISVTWISQGSVGNAVGIDLSTDGGSNWTSLVSGTTNDGSQVITVPNSPSTACRIRVQVPLGSPSDASDMNFTIEPSPIPPAVSVNPAELDFGEIEIGKTSTLDFQITNTGGGLLSGSISTDKKWIEVTPTSFSGNNVTITVTVDNSILNQTEGQYTGEITILSNGPINDTVIIDVTVTATCVLTRPNPYDPTEGPLTFFGDGILPGETTIKIYTLGGELVKTLRNVETSLEVTKVKEIEWDGNNENGAIVTSGIYIYVYESSKEKGAGKFTVIKK